MDIYKKDQIENIEISAGAENTVTIDVRPILETVYYLSGACVKDVDGRLRINLIRCSIGSQCEVDVPATVDAGAPNPYSMTLENRDMPIDIEFKDGSVRGLYEPNE